MPPTCRRIISVIIAYITISRYIKLFSILESRRLKTVGRVTSYGEIIQQNGGGGGGGRTGQNEFLTTIFGIIIVILMCVSFITTNKLHNIITAKRP